MARRALVALEERFNHELMDPDERQELGEEIVKLRRRLNIA